MARFLHDTGTPFRVDHLPSRVPDWSTYKASNALGYLKPESEAVYNAGCGLAQNWRLTDYHYVIVGRGVIIDTLTVIGSISMPSCEGEIGIEKDGSIFQ
jgi:hypothetical protein